MVAAMLMHLLTNAVVSLASIKVKTRTSLLLSYRTIFSERKYDSSIPITRNGDECGNVGFGLVSVSVCLSEYRSSSEKEPRAVKVTGVAVRAMRMFFYESFY